VTPAMEDGLFPAPETPPPAPATYWENRGPRDWQPVTVTTRYGNCQGARRRPPFPLVRTKPLSPRNVTIRRGDGTTDVMPVRNLRRKEPR
jgi:hypothetical protein